MNALRRQIRSESQPDKMRSTVAVHSATPSMTPRLANDARSVPVTNAGSTGTIISVETSVSSDVKPSATTLRLVAGALAGGGDGGATVGVSVTTSRPYARLACARRVGLRGGRGATFVGGSDEISTS